MIVAMVTELVTGDGMNAITELVTGVGFPIACCIYLAYSNEKLRATIEENTKTIDALKTMFTIYFNKEKGDN